MIERRDSDAAEAWLPQLAGRMFLTDGGMETTFVFHDGIDLPCFAAIDLMRRAEGREHLRCYYERYIALARSAGAGFILESPTWRASPDWAAPLGLNHDELDQLNRQAVDLLHDLRTRHQSSELPVVVSGCVGPRGDGYRPQEVMSPEEAEAYHARQIGVFWKSGVDMVTAMTLTNVGEALGIVRAAVAHGLPVVISFTVETDGRLPRGDTLEAAVRAVDAATGNGPAYYMVNCAHPSHFGPALNTGQSWVRRIRGLRANASCKSHAELDDSDELDLGDPVRLGIEHRELLERLPQLAVLGGCCGTDHRHVQAIAQACLRAR